MPAFVLVLNTFCGLLPAPLQIVLTLSETVGVPFKDKMSLKEVGGQAPLACAVLTTQQHKHG